MKREGENPGRRKGRPRDEDRACVLAHFEAQIALERSVVEIAEAGLTLYGVDMAPDGRSVLVVRRTLRGRSLERRYRQYRAEIAHSIAKLHSDPLELVGPKTGSKGRRLITRTIGISSAPVCLSFPPRDDLKRGRPKK